MKTRIIETPNGVFLPQYKWMGLFWCNFTYVDWPLGCNGPVDEVFEFFSKDAAIGFLNTRFSPSKNKKSKVVWEYKYD